MYVTMTFVRGELILGTQCHLWPRDEREFLGRLRRSKTYGGDAHSSARLEQTRVNTARGFVRDVPLRVR